MKRLQDWPVCPEAVDRCRLTPFTLDRTGLTLTRKLKIVNSEPCIRKPIPETQNPGLEPGNTNAGTCKLQSYLAQKKQPPLPGPP